MAVWRKLPESVSQVVEFKDKTLFSKSVTHLQNSLQNRAGVLLVEVEGSFFGEQIALRTPAAWRRRKYSIHWRRLGAGRKPGPGVKD